MKARPAPRVEGARWSEQIDPIEEGVGGGCQHPPDALQERSVGRPVTGYEIDAGSGGEPRITGLPAREGETCTIMDFDRFLERKGDDHTDAPVSVVLPPGFFEPTIPELGCDSGRPDSAGNSRSRRLVRGRARSETLRGDIPQLPSWQPDSSENFEYEIASVTRRLRGFCFPRALPVFDSHSFRARSPPRDLIFRHDISTPSFRGSIGWNLNGRDGHPRLSDRSDRSAVGSGRRIGRAVGSWGQDFSRILLVGTAGLWEIGLLPASRLRPYPPTERPT
jgi:hypothetical protein